jgi:cytochrome P450 family 110
MSLPEGPKDLKIWQMVQWIATPISFMRRCRRRFGDRFTVKLTRELPPVVFFSDPKALQVILTNDDSELFDAPGELNVLLQPLLGTQSVIGLSGEPHRQMRQLLMPSFHGERMRAYGQLIHEIAEKVISEWETGKPFSVRKNTQKISLRVILRAVFGLNEGARYQQLEQLLGSLLDGLSHPAGASFIYFAALRRDLGPRSPWGRFIRLREQIDKLIFAEIDDRRANPNDGRSDILTMLMSACDEAGEGLTEQELHDELMTLLVAGHETTATALAWALHWISKLPMVREKLMNELAAVADPLDPNILFRLPYLNAVCSETLRICPVGMLTFPRVTKSRVELTGASLDPGTVVVGCIYLAHHREDVYPDPDAFRPERFLDRRYSPYEYLPFGGGARRCIGMSFAQFEMKVVLNAILSAVELAHADARPVRLVRRGLTSGPSPFRMIVKRRTRQFVGSHRGSQRRYNGPEAKVG